LRGSQWNYENFLHSLTVLSAEEVKIDLLSGLQDTANWEEQTNKIQ